MVSGKPEKQIEYYSSALVVSIRTIYRLGFPDTRCINGTGKFNAERQHCGQDY